MICAVPVLEEQEMNMTKNILLVEYDESTINFIKDLLPPPMFEVVVANDGETAKHKLAEKTFDLMITAAMLPRFHGFNLALTVAQENPLIKIIIISAIYKGFYYKHQATSQYRADDFFEKPLEKESFKNRVLELLNLSAKDFPAVIHAATTHVPISDTVKSPTLAKLEENKLSADDIFGDLLKNIDKLPEFKIELNGDQAPKNAKPDKEAPRQPAPSQTVLLKKEPEVVHPIEKPDSGKTLIPTPPIEMRKVPESKKPAASSQSINDNLDSLRQTVKKQMPENKMRKIEDDIARRFEDTLSGLGIQPVRSAPKPPGKAQEKPAEMPAPPAPEKVSARKEEKSLVDEIIEFGEEPFPAKEEEKSPVEEIIELGEESLQKDKQPEPIVEVKPEKKVQPVDNPNELGDYVLLGLIARGGMAEIYKAKRKGVKGFEKIIAIKKILSGYGEDDKYIEMLVDEAKIAAELSHPNIIQIYDLGRKDNYYFIAMEYVLGKDLREIQGRLREKDQWFPEEISLFLCIKILEALNYAHKAKDSHGHALEIVHRDVSPPNILISYNGDVKLTDFGISKASIKMHHTISGALKGKLLYMSPEQARGEGTIDCRSDLYSVGVVLFELLTSKKLFLDTSEMGVLKKVQNGEILNPREINPDIDPALEKIILKSLNKTCDKRYQSAAAMIADLEAFMIKKYNYLPGPVQLSHFIYHLFEKEIVRDGIKVDLKPLPEKPLLREIPKALPEPPELPKPLPVQESKVIEPAATVEKPIPPQPPADKRAEVVRIDFDEEKIVPAKKKATAAPQEIKITAPLFQAISEEKKKKPIWPIAIVLVVMAAAALGYFLVLKKPAAGANQAEAKPLIEEKTAAQSPIVQKPAPAIDPNVLAAEKLKQEEALQKQLLAAAEDAAQKKKLQEEKRAKQAETERLKKEEEDRLKQEELDRLQKEEAQKKQEEADRLAKEAQDLKKAEELKEIERKRVKEGDIIPLSDVDKEPAVVSKPEPIIPSSMRTSMTSSQTVMFNILINQNGDVEVARLLQKTNNSQLNTILIATIKTWKYTAATKNGVRVKVWKTIPLIIKK
jgi:serine/threonine protein kinase/DNA-binding response OmpR family regulator